MEEEETTKGGSTVNGAELIAAERRRQVEELGRTAEHDEQHDEGELADAAVAYVWGEASVWPWGETNRFDESGSADRIERLVKAGALLAAEIDRLVGAGDGGSVGMADPTALSAEEVALLGAVAEQNVTWHDRSVRLWASETDYTLVTRLARRLVERGLVSKEQAAGWRYAMRGPVELTPAGRAVLARPAGFAAGSPMLSDEHHRL